MNKFSTVKYNFFANIKATISFYIVLTAILIFNAVLSIIVSDDIQSNGVNLTSMIFVFVLGLNSFKSNFHFGLANSVSRKGVFVGFIGALAPLALLMSIVDTIIIFIFSRFSEITMLYSFYALADNNLSVKALMSNPLHLLLGTAWSFFAMIFIGCFCYFVTILYYRLSKSLKMIVSFGVPIVLFMGVPMLDILFFDNKLLPKVFKLVSALFGVSESGIRPYIASITFTVLAAIFAGISYLMMRRATIKMNG